MEFSFKCHAKTNLSEEANAFNESYVSFIRNNRPGSKYACRYVQTIAGKEAINAELMPVNPFTFEKRYWMPSDIVDPVSGDILLSFSFNSIVQHYRGMEMQLEGNNNQMYQILSAEGLVIRSCDDSQQTVSFNLLDGSLGGFADYFSFKRIGDTGELSYYKIVDDSLVLIKECKNLICKDTY